MLLAILRKRLKKEEKFLSCVTEGGVFLVSTVDMFTNLTGTIDEVRKRNVLCGEYVVCPSVTLYQSLNHSSDFHDIPCKPFFKKLCRANV